MSLRSCETRHLRMTISTGGMPSACSRSLILLCISSFSFEGIRIHLVQSSCASASCFASSLVINFFVSPARASTSHPATHVEAIPLLPVMPRSGPGLVDRRIYPYTHVRMSTPSQRPLKKGRGILEPQGARGAREFRAQRSTPRIRLVLAGFCFCKGLM